MPEIFDLEIPLTADRQLLTFLFAICHKPEILKKIINFYSNTKNYFFLVNLFCKFEDIYQKTYFAVDDYVPITEDGRNLFTQVAGSTNNIVLTILEKCKKIEFYIKVGLNMSGFKNWRLKTGESLII